MLTTLLARMPCAAVVADDQGLIRAVTARWPDLLGRATPGAVLGTPLRDVVAAIAALAAPSSLEDLLPLADSPQGCERDVLLARTVTPPRGQALHLSAFDIHGEQDQQYRVLLAAESPASPERELAALERTHLAAALNQGLQPSLANLKSSALSLHAGARRWETAGHQELLRVVQRETDTVYEALGAYAELVALTAGATRLRYRPVELSDTLMRLLAEWKPAAPAHAFELAMPGEVPLLSADEDQVALALNLLLEHAVRLTPNGDTIHVDIRPSAEGITVGIHHRGHAPAQDELTSLFEPFFRQRSAPEALVRGGLGLALARAVVIAHGGRIWAETRPGQPGMAVALTLPYAPPQAATPQMPEHTPELPSAPMLAARGAKQCVLIAESDTRMLRYLRANLDGERFRAISAANAADARLALDRDEPDIILLDAHLPGDVLPELVRSIREDTSAPVIVLARRHDPAQAAEVLDLGATDYIAKPFGIDELLARVRVALRHRDAALRVASREPVFEHGGLVIDFEQRSVSVDGKPVALSKTEFKLLRALAQHRNMVLSHELLLERVWGPAYSREVEFVWVYIRRLRRKIESDPSAPRYIITVPGVGYRLASGKD